MNIAKFLRTAFLKEQHWWLLLLRPVSRAILKLKNTAKIFWPNKSKQKLNLLIMQKKCTGEIYSQNKLKKVILSIFNILPGGT